MRRSWGRGKGRGRGEEIQALRYVVVCGPSPSPSAFSSVARMHETNKQPMDQQINRYFKQPRSFIIQLQRISQSNSCRLRRKKKNPKDTPILQLNQSAVMQRGDTHAPVKSSHKSLLSSRSSLSSHPYGSELTIGSSSLTVTTRNHYPRTATPFFPHRTSLLTTRTITRNHYLAHLPIITTTCRLRGVPSPLKSHHTIPLTSHHLLTSLPSPSDQTNQPPLPTQVTTRNHFPHITTLITGQTPHPHHSPLITQIIPPYHHVAPAGSAVNMARVSFTLLRLFRLSKGNCQDRRMGGSLILFYVFFFFLIFKRRCSCASPGMR